MISRILFSKSSFVVPVFKNDRERSDPGKYRHISRLPINSKIFESFINDSLTKHLDVTDLFSDLQYGFLAFPLLTSSLFSVRAFTTRRM